MKGLSAASLYLALLHYPVTNRNGETIASAVTNFDIHDLARVVETYGVKLFYVVTPLEDQQLLVGQIIRHWTEGVGSELNPDRCQALRNVCIQASLADVCDHIRKQTGHLPVTVATCAKNYDGSIDFSQMRGMLGSGKPYVLLMGTAWGLTPGFILAADHVLKPVVGSGPYNHLSVRSATSIILDRLLGE